MTGVPRIWELAAPRRGMDLRDHMDRFTSLIQSTPLDEEREKRNPSAKRLRQDVVRVTISK
jgi:hypothetical protein